MKLREQLVYPTPTVLAGSMLLLSALAACSSSSSSPCTARAGTYSATFSRRDGTCGYIPEVIFVIGGESTTPSRCTGRAQSSTDGCDVQYDITCPLNGGGTFTERGTSSWSTDATSGHGTEQVIINVPDVPGASCTGTYDVTYRRL